MSEWIATPLQQGAPPENHYTCTISELEPNSVYEYRAYIIVDGVPYCGNVRQAVTLSVPSYVPSVSTGFASCVTNNSMRICGNIVMNNGNSDIYEYGVLYTQIQAYGTSNKLITENYPLFVCKKSICTNIPVGQEYFINSICEITGLAQNTVTFYRAFSTNNCGSGYGLVNSKITQNTGTIPLVIGLSVTSHSTQDKSAGILCTNPAMPNGECVNYSLNVWHEVSEGGNGTTTICCKPNGSAIFSEIFDCRSSVSHIYSVPITICYGDMICWSQAISGGAGSFSVIQIDSINSYTSGIYPMISTNCYCDKVISTEPIPE